LGEHVEQYGNAPCLVGIANGVRDRLVEIGCGLDQAALLSPATETDTWLCAKPARAWISLTELARVGEDVFKQGQLSLRIRRGVGEE
jgi:hypothetical protein